MPFVLEVAAWSALGLWVVVLVLPWRPWAREPSLDVDPGLRTGDLSDVTALVPARNEAGHLPRTLNALTSQGEGLRVVVVDDQSHDDTAGVASEILGGQGQVVRGRALPQGWSGKLWALEQGRAGVQTPLVLLMDADIELAPGILAAAREKLERGGLDLVSLMAEPAMDGFWDRLLMPAFVYFFRLLYPFRLSNSRFPRVAAAAGGFILMRREVLDSIGGFGALRHALIDDCTLAARAKQSGARTWIGLTRSVHSVRSCRGLGEIRDMVARTAYTQLRHSVLLLVVCTLLMGLAFVVPLVALGSGSATTAATGAGGLVVMGITYVPTLRFYGLSPLWALGLPLTGLAYLLMTWVSAWRFWKGRKATWRGRTYASEA